VCTAVARIHAPGDQSRPLKPVDQQGQRRFVQAESVNRVGFRLGNRKSTASREFAALYNRCGVSRCGLMPEVVIEAVSNAGFPMYAACHIAGWPSELATVVVINGPDGPEI
jgi:hypothetical protein